MLFNDLEFSENVKPVEIHEVCKNNNYLMFVQVKLLQMAVFWKIRKEVSLLAIPWYLLESYK